MIRIFSALTICATLAACAAPVTSTQRLELTAAQVATIENTVRYRMKDPESAQFRNIRSSRVTRDDGTVNQEICGQVNGRNSFGGYVGFQTFTGRLVGDQFQIILAPSADSAIAESMICGSYGM